jgi:methyl-accepting chemotaxis protein
MLGEMKPFGEGTVMLVSPGGNWVSHPDKALRTKPYAEDGLEDLKALLAGGPAHTVDRIRDGGGREVRRLFTPASVPGIDGRWSLVTDIPTSAISGPADRLAFALMAGGLAMLGLVLFALLTMTNIFVRRPLARITGAVNALSAGRYEEPIRGTELKDEIGSIARACPAEIRPARSSSSTPSGNFSSRTAFATVERSLPTRDAISSCV